MAKYDLSWLKPDMDWLNNPVQQDNDNAYVQAHGYDNYSPSTSLDVLPTQNQYKSSYSLSGDQLNRMNQLQSKQKLFGLLSPTESNELNSLSSQQKLATQDLQRVKDAKIIPYDPKTAKPADGNIFDNSDIVQGAKSVLNTIKKGSNQAYNETFADNAPYNDTLNKVLFPLRLVGDTAENIPVVNRILSGADEAMGTEPVDAFGNPIEKMSTGSKVFDKLTDMAGNLVGYATMPGPGGGSPLNFTDSASNYVSKTVANRTAQALPSLVKTSEDVLYKPGMQLANKLLPSFLRGAIDNGAISLVEDLGNGKDAETTAKDVATNSLLGGGLFAAGHGLYKKLVPDVAEPKTNSVAVPKLQVLESVENSAAPKQMSFLKPLEATGTDGIAVTETPKVKVESKYVDTNPIDINIKNTDKATAQDIRNAYTEKYHGQIVAGNQLADNIKKIAPKEQEAIQLYIDAGGDKTHLQSMIDNPSPRLDEKIPDSNLTYREAYKQALNLSPKAQEAARMAQQYYSEQGKYSAELGTTKGVIDNYANRMWKQEPKGNIKYEGNKGGLSTYTSHSQQRVYGNIGEGVLNGSNPVTLKANDLLSLHNQEMARANTNMELAASIKNSGIGNFSKGNVPEGWTAVDSLSKHIPTKDGTLVQNFVVPKGIADGMKAITDPNYLKMWGKLEKLNKYQGVVKTIDLSYSLFHHITMAAQALYNNKGGIDFIRHFKDLTKLDTPEFQAMERDFVRHTGMTTKVEQNLDTLGRLTEKNSIVDKLTNIPGLKQLKQFSNANTEFLFGKMQRWLKVTDYNMKVLDYVAKHPQSTDTILTDAKRSIAKEVNNAYGGLNFAALGRNKTTLSLERLALLAPDWTESSVRMFGQALKPTLKDPGTNAARMQYLIGIGGGVLLTEGLNHILTGHFTDKNPKGHELEVEVQPGVYVSAFRSGIGDLTKWGSNMITDGTGGGTSRFFQGKFSPVTRTVVGMAANKNYNGQSIYGNDKLTPAQNDLNILKFLGQSGTPMPFGVSNAQNYNNSGEATPLGNLLVDSGLARYSKSNTNPDNPAVAYQGNWLNEMFNKSDDQQLLSSLNKFNTQSTKTTKQMNAELLDSIKSNGNPLDVLNKYNISGKKADSLIKSAQAKLDSYKKSELQQKFDKMSAKSQRLYLETLTEQDRQNLLNNVKLKPLKN